MKRAALLALAGLALADPAWACPYCASRGDGGAAYLLALAGIIALPFGVVAIVLPLVRRRPPDPGA